jgi:hypothetical protein
VTAFLENVKEDGKCKRGDKNICNVGKIVHFPTQLLILSLS